MGERMAQGNHERKIEEWMIDLNGLNVCVVENLKKKCFWHRNGVKNWIHDSYSIWVCN